PQEQERLLNLSLAGAGRDALEKEVRNGRAAELGPAVKLSRVRGPLPSGGTVVVSGPALSLSGLAEALGPGLDCARRASRDALDVKTAERVWRDRARSGGK